MPKVVTTQHFGYCSVVLSLLKPVAYLPTVPILEGQSLFLVHCPTFYLLKIRFVPIFCDFFVQFFPNKLGNFGYFCQVS